MAELRLNLDPTGVETGSDRAEDALAGVAQAALRTEDALDDVSRRSMPRAGRAGRAMGGSMRQVSMQLSQVVQQTQATGNAVQAMAIQLPDIGLAFGLWGTILGVVAGVTLPLLIDGLGGTGASADTLSDQMDTLDAATQRLNDGLKLQKGDAEALAEAYGLVIAQAQALNAIGLEISLREQREALGELLDTARLTKTGITEFDDAMVKLRAAVSSNEGLALAGAAAFGQYSAEIQTAVQSLYDLGVAAVDPTVTTGELRLQTADLIQTLEGMNDVAFDPLITQLLDVVRGLGGVEGAARNATQALRETIAQGNAADQLVNNPDFFDPRGEGDAGRIFRDRRNPQGRTTRVSRGGGGGGGGASQVDTLAREFERLRGQIDPTWRALQQYNEAIDVLNRAMAGGYVDGPEEYAILLEQIEGKFKSLGDVAESVGQTIEQAMTDAFMGIVDGTLDADEAFKQMASSIIAELFRVLVVQQLVGSFSSGGGGILGGIFSLFGGASGGAPAGGSAPLAVSAGAAGFAAVTGQAQPANANGGVTVVQHNTFQSGVTRQEVAAMTPQLVVATKNAVRDDMQRRPKQWGN